MRRWLRILYQSRGFRVRHRPKDTLRPAYYHDRPSYRFSFFFIMGFPVFKSFYQRIGYVLTTLGVKHVISTYQVLTDKIQFFQTVIESRSRNTQLLGGTLNGKITNSMTLPSTTGADWLECSILYLYYLSVICTNIVFILATFIVFRHILWLSRTFEYRETDWNTPYLEMAIKVEHLRIYKSESYKQNK